MPKITKCPNCGASLGLDASLTTFFCPYCGTKISNVNGVIKLETVNRYVDEAELEKAKLEAKRYKDIPKILVLIVLVVLFWTIVFPYLVRRGAGL